ncbi:hypothetical protein DPMN_139171 [Dreissena polymorpha]|uniref:Uncharacterized protein n=1 Tax=Dreissena polymorpha TaxID=45954 RepID=A0A9D4G5A5_DREPO|nr:hypothetical protein DPMN_139171 [Dreissena polymorpha]
MDLGTVRGSPLKPLSDEATIPDEDAVSKTGSDLYETSNLYYNVSFSGSPAN